MTNERSNSSQPSTDFEIFLTAMLVGIALLGSFLCGLIMYGIPILTQRFGFPPESMPGNYAAFALGSLAFFALAVWVSGIFRHCK